MPRKPIVDGCHALLSVTLLSWTMDQGFDCGACQLTVAGINWVAWTMLEWDFGYVEQIHAFCENRQDIYPIG